MDRGAWWATVHSVAKKWLNTHAPKSSVRFQRSKVHPTRVPPPQMPIASPGCYLCFWQTGFKLKVPTTPSLGLTDLLEWIRSQSSSRSFGSVSDSLKAQGPSSQKLISGGQSKSGLCFHIPWLQQRLQLREPGLSVFNFDGDRSDSAAEQGWHCWEL